MATSGISGTNTINGAGGILGRAPTTRSFNDLKSEDFFALLIAQLQAQDPLKPADNQALLQQMSMIRQMEQSTTLNKSLGALAGEQRFAATAGLIGHYVGGTVTDVAGNSVGVQGVVVGVIYERDGSAVLQLHNGRNLPAEKVEQVTLLENLPPELLEQIERELGGGAAPPSGGATPPGGSTPPTPPDGNPPVNDASGSDVNSPDDDTQARAARPDAATQAELTHKATERQTWLAKLLRAARARQAA